MKGKGPGKGRRCSWNTEITPHNDRAHSLDEHHETIYSNTLIHARSLLQWVRMYICVLIGARWFFWTHIHLLIQNTESLLSTLIVTDHQCYRAIKSLQTTVHSNTIDTYNSTIQGPANTNVAATCRKNLSQWERSFLWKLRCHWPKIPRRAAKTLAIEDPGAHVTNAKRPLTRSPQQKAQLWLADAKASPNHSQAPRQKLPAKTPLALTT